MGKRKIASQLTCALAFQVLCSHSINILNSNQFLLRYMEMATTLWK
jgi:hypothetical protein